MGETRFTGETLENNDQCPMTSEDFRFSPIIFESNFMTSCFVHMASWQRFFLFLFRVGVCRVCPAGLAVPSLYGKKGGRQGEEREISEDSKKKAKKKARNFTQVVSFSFRFVSLVFFINSSFVPNPKFIQIPNNLASSFLFLRKVHFYFYRISLVFVFNLDLKHYS